MEMATTTDDFRALRADWASGHTQTIPCGPIEMTVEKARQEYLATRDMAERMRFSGWLNAIRFAVYEVEEKRLKAWGQAIGRGE